MHPAVEACVLVGSLVLVPRLVYRQKLGALLFLDLAIIPMKIGWQIAGVEFDLNDFILLALILALLRRGESVRSIRRAVPYLRWWLVLGLVLSLSYLAAPATQKDLTDPVRIAYQLCRYCWKPILYYPLAALIFREPRMTLAAIPTLVVLGDIQALVAIPQGYAGLRAEGLFPHPNALGAALVVPLVVCAGLFFLSVGRRLRVFCAVSCVLLIRALTLTFSRGALIASVVAVALVGIGALRSARARSRFIAASAVFFVLVLAVFAVKPDILERPTVRRALSATSPMEQDTFQWRIQKRWPHFWKIALGHPFLGVGSEVDRSLGKAANTPHNGYLAIAVKHGFPVLTLVLLFAALAARCCLRLIRHNPTTPTGQLGILLGASLAGLLIHNINESNLLALYPGNLFWMLVATAIVTERGTRVTKGKLR